VELVAEAPRDLPPVRMVEDHLVLVLVNLAFVAAIGYVIYQRQRERSGDGDTPQVAPENPDNTPSDSNPDNAGSATGGDVASRTPSTNPDSTPRTQPNGSNPGGAGTTAPERPTPRVQVIVEPEPEPEPIPTPLPDVTSPVPGASNGIGGSSFFGIQIEAGGSIDTATVGKLLLAIKAEMTGKRVVSPDLDGVIDKVRAEVKKQELEDFFNSG